MAAAIACVLLSASVVMARAGGGEGFGGGGGGVGGGGGGGGGAILQLLIFLVIEQPEIGIPLIIIFGIGYWFTHRKVAGAITNNRIDRGMQAEGENLGAAALASLQSADPAFDPQVFYGRVTQAFLKMQDAWCQQNLTTVQAFISDGVRERFSLEFMQAKLLCEQDRMSAIQVLSAALAHATHDHLYDTAIVEIQASAIDQTISTKNGSVLSGSAEAQPFCEYWTFLRRRGAKSTDKPGLMEGNCPNCGAQLSINQSTQCPNCHAMIFSGEFDWVLTEITQASRWRPESEADVPGVEDLIHRDGDFSLAELEDTASVMFWRKSQADLTGKINPLKKICTPEFASLYEGLLKPAPDGSRTVWGHCAVGSVSTLGIIPGASVDRALIEIVWSAQRFTIHPDGSISHTPSAELSTSMLVLQRNHDCKTNIQSGISSAHCPNCGAPLTDDTSDACPFCGTVLTDGAQGWVLAKMLPLAEPEAQDLLRSVAATGVTAAASAASGAAPAVAALQPPSAPKLMAWATGCVLAGDVADDQYDGLLMRIGQDQGLPDQMVRQIILAGHTHGLSVPQPTSPAVAMEWFGEIIKASMELGPITPAMQQLFTRIGGTLNMGPYDLKLLIARQRDALSGRAGAAIKLQRSQAAA